MPTKLTLKANERSTYVISLAFTDETDAPMTPNTMTWTLTDTLGNVINSREDVVMTGLSTIANVVLHGDDLVIESYGCKRKVSFQGTYDSTYGSGLEYADECTFEMNDAVAVV